MHTIHEFLLTYYMIGFWDRRNLSLQQKFVQRLFPTCVYVYVKVQSLTMMGPSQYLHAPQTHNSFFPRDLLLSSSQPNVSQIKQSVHFRRFEGYLGAYRWSVLAPSSFIVIPTWYMYFWDTKQGHLTAVLISVDKTVFQWWVEVLLPNSVPCLCLCPN